MGQKVHPTGFRLGISTEYTSKWYAVEQGKREPSLILTEASTRLRVDDRHVSTRTAVTCHLVLSRRIDSFEFVRSDKTDGRCSDCHMR